MISLPPKGNSAKELGSYFAPLKVQAQAMPDMTVRVAEGAFWTADNEHQEYIGGTSPTMSAPSSDAKWVLITVTTTGMLNVVNGAASTTPVLPDPSQYKDELPLAAIFIGDTVTVITSDMIFDLRPMWSIPPDSVNQSQLTDFATITYVNNGLNLKANVDGTKNPNFTLNVGGSNINDSGIYVDRFGGKTAAIRFNETAPVGSPPVSSAAWEFTNDGVTWNPIGVSTGSYYTKTDLDTVGVLDGRYFTHNDLNVTGVLDPRYYEKTLADSTFAPTVHMHDASDINGLSDPVVTINGLSPTNGDVQLGLNELNDVTNALPADKNVIVMRSGAYMNDMLTTDDLGDVDTTSTTPTGGDVLIHNGSGGFVNRSLVKGDISDFTGGEFVLTTNLAGDAPNGSNGTDQDIYGVKTFKDGVVIETSLVVTGANTSIETTDLKVTDPYIILNAGELGDGVGGAPTPGVGGIAIDRGFVTGSPGVANPAAVFQWDEGTQQWEAGVQGDANPILTGAHNHVSTEITDFAVRTTAELGNNNLDTIGDVNYSITPTTGEYLRYGVNDWENKDFATDVNTELNVNTLDQMQDVVYLGSPVLAPGQSLQWNGAAWENHVPVKADITDFVETDYIHTTGDETKAGNLTITGDFIVDDNSVGSETRIKSEHVYISDSIITLNADETIDGAVTTAGIEVIRGPTFQNSLLRWDEGSGNWLITTGNGATLVTSQISTAGHSHIVTDITDLSVTALELNTLVGIDTAFSVQQQLDDKISRQGDTMDNSANLTFAVNGEVLGLPVIPSATAATSKEYVDTEVARKIDRTGDVMDLNANLIFSGTGEVQGLPAIPLSSGSATSKAFVDAHIADMVLHLTAEQNTFLDGLALTGSPALTSADVNGLIGLGGTNIITALDGKTDKVTPAIDQNLAALDIATGNIVDSGVVVNDGGGSTLDLWTANKINTTKTNKLFGIVQNNFVTWDTSGEILDSGLILNDGGVLATDLWSGLQIDNQKVDKVPSAAAGNIAIFDANGNIEDTLVSPTDFAGLVHTHLTSDITDYSTAFTTELGLNDLQALGNVSNNPPATGDLLQWNGTIWDDVAGTSIGTFVKATGNVDESINGRKTFLDNTFFVSPVNFTQNVTINSDTAINGNLTVTGDFTVQGSEILKTNKILLNDGSTSAIDAHGGGVVLERDIGTGSPPTGNLPQAGLIWDDGTSQWLAGLSDDLQPIARVGVARNQPSYSLQVGSGNAEYNLGFGVPVPIVGRTALQVFVNGVKQIEGKAYTIDYTDTGNAKVTFIGGSPDSSIPLSNADVEFYGFGYIV